MLQAPDVMLGLQHSCYINPFHAQAKCAGFRHDFLNLFFHSSFFEAIRDYLSKIIWSLSDFQQYFGMLVLVGSNIKYLFGIAMFM
jgi:hypothetical protein